MRSAFTRAVEATSAYPIKTIVLVMAAIIPTAFGQAMQPPASLQYPLELNHRWTYALHQEFGPGVHPGEQDSAVANGNTIDTTVVSEVAGYDMMGGAKYARVESRIDGRLWLTEWLRLTPEGLFLSKTNEDGKETIIAPPQKILSATLAPGESWTWKASGARVAMVLRVIANESMEVPAGKFEATKTSMEMTMALPEANVRASMVRWFSPGVGFVRYDSETYAEDRFLTRTRMTLTGLESTQPAQVATPPSARGKSATPSNAAPSTEVRYEARWDIQPSGATDQLNSVYFSDINTGWTVGKNNTILKTSDGGKTWKRVLEREEGGNEFLSIAFTNGNEGWVRGSNILLHTADGGETWRPASPLPDRKSLGDGAAVGTTRLQMAQQSTSDRLYKSEDGGTTWSDNNHSAKLTRNDFESIFALDLQHIWVIGDYGRYALTIDAGVTWKEPQLPVKSQLKKVYFVSPAVGWILPSDHNGGPLATKDGGLTWASQYAGAGQNRPLRDIHFVNERDGFLLVGSNRPDVVYRTSDGGVKWQTIGQLPEGRTSMSFPTVDNGWVVGPQGYVVHYHLVPVAAGSK